MPKYIDSIVNYSEGNFSKRNMKKFEKELDRNLELQLEYSLYRQISSYMRGKFDLEEAKNDPDLQYIEPVIKDAILDFQQNADKIQETRKFVRGTLNEKLIDFDLKEEINQIKREIDIYDLDDISEGWVKDWIEKNQNIRKIDPNVEKMREFILNSIESKRNYSRFRIISSIQDSFIKSLRFSSIGLAAAVLIVGVILIKSLVPSENNENLYKEFFKPMYAVSPITRGNNSGFSAQYVEALKKYNQEDYRSAANLFNDIIKQNGTLEAPHLFQGITQLELGNHDLAISHFSKVVESSQEYLKEAQWYLGLSYLKMGDKSKAIFYFKTLSETEGFYRDQSKALLRRL